jgi:acyl-CoA synthetase (AMP-forming)/AMP-acid ligase II
MYFTGDGCRRDEDGYYWITGRVDDVLNVSGHRIGTAEIESALVADTKVAEAAVVGFPHDIKGQGIYCFVTLKQGIEPSDDLKQRTRPIRPPRDRPDRDARHHPIRARPAKDPQRQNHAPHPAQNRRKRSQQSRRHRAHTMKWLA